MKGGDMLSISQILCDIENTVGRLTVCDAERRFADMPYNLGLLAGYSLLLQEIVNSKLQEPEEVTNEVEV